MKQLLLIDLFSSFAELHAVQVQCYALHVHLAKNNGTHFLLGWGYTQAHTWWIRAHMCSRIHSHTYAHTCTQKRIHAHRAEELERASTTSINRCLTFKPSQLDLLQYCADTGRWVWMITHGAVYNDHTMITHGAEWSYMVDGREWSHTVRYTIYNDHTMITHGAEWSYTVDGREWSHTVRYTMIIQWYTRCRMITHGRWAWMITHGAVYSRLQRTANAGISGV